MTVERMLITGCAGDIAGAMARIAIETAVAGKIIGADIRQVQAQSSPFFATHILPRADAPDYLAQLERLLKNEKIDLLVPGSEAELGVLLRAGWLDGKGPIRVIAANRRALEVGLDKLETNRMLVDAELPSPWTMLVSDGKPQAIPCILKQRSGQGSKGLYILREWPPAAEIDIASRQGDIFQEYMPDDEAEFTCGLYRTRTGEIRTVILRRKLSGGLTGSATLEESPAIHSLLVRLADILDLRGSVNAQLRLHEGLPKIFEINPRFSSTVGFRHAIGFEDFLWSVLEAFDQPATPMKLAQTGTRFSRDAAGWGVLAPL